MRIITAILLLLIPTVLAAAPAVDTPSAFTHGSAKTLTGSGFTTHGNNNAGSFTWESSTYLQASFKDFEDSSTTSNGFAAAIPAGISIKDGGPTNSTKYLGTTAVGTRLTNNGFTQSSNSTGTIFTSFWYKEKLNDPQGGKLWRWYFGSNPSNDNIYLSTSASAGFNLSGDLIANCGPGGHYTVYGGDISSDWHKVDVYISASTGVQVWVDGSSYVSLTGGSNPWTECTFNMSPSGHTVEYPNMSEVGDVDPYVYDDIYIDYTPARVEICNGSTWANKGVCNTQIITSWSSTSIGVIANQGTFSSGQTKYLYVVDNTNAANSSGIGVTFGSGGEDTTAPIITAFTMPETATSTTVSVSSFTATDDVAVTGYCITTVNDSSGCSWTGTAPTTAIGAEGANTFYAWARDAALNVSAASTDTTTITLPECTYYVRPDGNNSNTGTANTSGGAWLTLQNGANNAEAGDTVCVADGTYVGFYVENAGTSGSPITFRALGTGANINEPNWRSGTERVDGINIESYGEPADYIVIDGFNVYNQPRMGIRAIDGTGIVIKNCTTYDNVDTGIFSANTPSIQVLNNNSYTNGTTVYQHNIYISNAESDSPIIRGNTIRDSNSGNGLHVNGDWLEGGDGFIDNAIIEDNLVYGNAAKGLSLTSMRYGLIQNNVIYNNGGAGGVHIVEQMDSHYSIDNVVVNNTIDEPSVATVRVNSGNTGNVIFNNVSIGLTGIVFEGSGNYQSNNVTTTTGFTNYAAHDYSLATGSDKIDAGLSTYQSEVPPTDDILGLSRPQNSLYDAGAYEFEDIAEPPAPTVVATGTQFSGCSIN